MKKICKILLLFSMVNPLFAQDNESEGDNSSSSLIGDVNYEEVAKKCSYISPVPGGVGPMTIASLLMNTYKSANEKRN